MGALPSATELCVETDILIGLVADGDIAAGGLLGEFRVPVGCLRAGAGDAGRGRRSASVDLGLNVEISVIGIPADAAKTLLMYAFLNESLEDLADDEFRKTLTDELLSTMPGGDFIRTL